MRIMGSWKLIGYDVRQRTSNKECKKMKEQEMIFNIFEVIMNLTVVLVVSVAGLVL